MGNASKGPMTSEELAKEEEHKLEMQYRRKYSLGRCFGFELEPSGFLVEELVDLLPDFHFDVYLKKMVILLLTYMKIRKTRIFPPGTTLLFVDYFGYEMGKIVKHHGNEEQHEPLTVTINVSKSIVRDTVKENRDIKLSDEKMEEELKLFGNGAISVKTYVKTSLEIIVKFLKEERERNVIEARQEEEEINAQEQGE